MNNFNWEEFKNGKVVVWCDTEEKAKEFIKECYKRGMKWWKHAEETLTLWGVNKDETCYTFDYSHGRTLGYCDKKFYEEEGFKIIKWDDTKMIQCNNCKCKPVCKEVENWKNYCEEHIRLREKSILFDEEPKCPYYIEDKKVTDSNIERIIDDWFKKDSPLIDKPISTKNTNIKPMSIEFENGSEIKTIPYDDTVVRSRRSEEQLKYIPLQNKDELMKSMIKVLFG